MKIITLLENNTCNDALVPKHGMSLYIESESRKILFDIGPDDSFVKNAHALGVDLSAVQYLIISHGHYDHGGALNHFARVNQQAKIFMHRTARYQRVARGLKNDYREIGLKFDAALNERILFLDNNYPIDDHASIVMNFDGEGFVPNGNRSLFEKGPDGSLHNDAFKHEIALIIDESGKHVFFTGCSHSGISNMMNNTRQYLGGRNIDYVIGGFHIYNPATKSLEQKDRIDTLIAELEQFQHTIFYTGHCTSTDGYGYLKQRLKSAVREFHSGSVIHI